MEQCAQKGRRRRRYEIQREEREERGKVVTCLFSLRKTQLALAKEGGRLFCMRLALPLIPSSSFSFMLITLRLDTVLHQVCFDKMQWICKQWANHLARPNREFLPEGVF